MVIIGPSERVHIHPEAALDRINAVPLFTVNSGQVYIGAFVIFGYRVQCFCGHHDYTKRGAARRPCPSEGYDIHIEEGVWIASSVTLIGPCTVGKDAVVAAGSTVIPGTVIPPGELWGGYPARFIKKIAFDGEI